MPIVDVAPLYLGRERGPRARWSCATGRRHGPRDDGARRRARGALRVAKRRRHLDERIRRGTDARAWWRERRSANCSGRCYGRVPFVVGTWLRASLPILVRLPGPARRTGGNLGRGTGRAEDDTAPAPKR